MSVWYEEKFENDKKSIKCTFLIPNKQFYA